MTRLSGTNWIPFDLFSLNDCSGPPIFAKKLLVYPIFLNNQSRIAMLAQRA